MSYVDGFIVPVPKRKLAAYRRLASLGRKVWLDHGATDYLEAVAADVKWGKRTSFPRSVKLKRGETLLSRDLDAFRASERKRVTEVVKRTSFPRSIKQKKGETVVFAYIVYKSRKHRDRVNAKVMKDKRLAGMGDIRNMPFDAKRMIFGGFKAIVEA